MYWICGVEFRPQAHEYSGLLVQRHTNGRERIPLDPPHAWDRRQLVIGRWTLDSLV